MEILTVRQRLRSDYQVGARANDYHLGSSELTPGYYKELLDEIKSEMPPLTVTTNQTVASQEPINSFRASIIVCHN